ncbi:IS3 family transposase [Vibrio fluvialis]|uniref:IS3 family transposase n=1 Tax=Vibrio fluvialis TaxID=676 RepID=UPI001ABE0364|nr:IS3 family transposase [Vibrio fluvialis]QTH06966.1 IS3 family transposase [Vibrio fluvialis]
MKTTSKRTQRDYSLAFKLTVVDQVEKGEMTYKQAQERYGIQGRSTVLVWLRKHGQLNWSKGIEKPNTVGDGMPDSPSTQTPEQRIKELEQQLEETQLKADFFEAVVKVMDRDFGVRISKKRKAELLRKKPVKRLTVTQACLFIGITRQAFYKRCALELQRARKEQSVIGFVKEQRMRHPRLGTRKLKYLLAQHNIDIGRDRLFLLLKQHRLLVFNRRAYHRTTNSHHRFHCHPNRVKEGMVPNKPEQLWVADMTYLATRAGNAYLSLITDAYSRKIVGYHLDDNMKTQAVKSAFLKALKKRRYEGELIHHSDRGIQYCSEEYQSLHRKYHVTCSMTDGYDCYQNALAERVNGILKMEYLLTKPNDLNEARKMVAESVKLYNEQRPHTALKYKTPDEVHRAF